MARSKEFDVDQALDRAMEVFWLRGYAATSMQDLLVEMGIGRQSLYDTFGDKHRLFLAALDRFRTNHVDAMLAPLEGSDASLDAIGGYFNELIDIVTGPMPRKACLLVNSAMELALHDEDVARRVRDHLARVEAAFHNALSRSMARGEVPRIERSRAISRYLTSTAQGLIVMGKQGASARVLRDVVDVALSVISNQ